MTDHAERPLVIAMDAEHSRQSRAGTFRFAAGLASALRQRADTTVVLVGGGPLGRRGALRKKITTLRQHFWWYPYAGRRSATAAGADVYHCPTPGAPMTRGRLPLVVTVHDLAALRFPQTLTPWSRLYERATLRRVLQAADRVTAPSSDTANDLQVLLGLPAAKIRIVHNGVDEAFFRSTSEAPTVGGPYVLFVGTPQPRKNLPRLIAAVQRLRARGHDERLVIAGGNGWGDLALKGPHVDWLGSVSDAELRGLYAHASCLALVSLHEGFGIPAIEAMAAQTPVVASAVGALPEVTDGAAVLVDPLDVEAIADGLAAAIADRDRLVELGRERARTFTWAAAAEQARAVYQELA